jgi:hypothetical protein
MDQIIPLTSDPNQELQINPIVDGAALNLRLNISWNEMAQYWTMKISDPKTGGCILDSIPLVAGDYPAANLLGQFAYLGIGSAYIINAGQVPIDSPDDTNLGTDFILLWGDTPGDPPADPPSGVIVEGGQEEMQEGIIDGGAP